MLYEVITGERGFLIIGEEKYLEPYNNGLFEFENEITNLKKLVSDNPAQVERLEGIHELAKSWIDKAGNPDVITSYSIHYTKLYDPETGSPFSGKRITRSRQVLEKY